MSSSFARSFVAISSRSALTFCSPSAAFSLTCAARSSRSRSTWVRACVTASSFSVAKDVFWASSFCVSSAISASLLAVILESAAICSACAAREAASFSRLIVSRLWVSFAISASREAISSRASPRTFSPASATACSRCSAKSFSRRSISRLNSASRTCFTMSAKPDSST